MSERDELIECLRVCGACHGCGIGADGDTCTNCGDERQLNRLAASLLERDGAELERLQHDIERHVSIAAEQATEIARLHAGGCARDQRLTQYCAEAQAALARAEAAEKDAARWKHVRSVPAVSNPLMIVDFQTNTAYVGDKADEMADAGIAEWTRAAQQAGAS